MAADPVGYLINFAEGGSWYELSILACFASVLLYGIVLSISRAFDWKNLEGTARTEILQAFATLFMVMIVIWSVEMAEQFSINYFLGAGTVACGGETIDTDSIENTFKIVECRFAEHGLAIANIQTHIRNYADISFHNAFVYKSTLVYMFGAQIFSGSWVEAWYKETENYRLMNSFSTSVLIRLNIILVLLKYLSNSMLTVFLPLGLFLRAFAPTRGVGAFFIATAIGFYFIFPVLFVFTDPGFVVTEELQKPIAPSTAPQPCYPTFSGIASQMASSTMSSSLAIGNIQQAASDIAKFNVFISVQPFVVFSITVVFIRYMIYILGGEAYAIMRYLAKVV